MTKTRRRFTAVLLAGALLAGACSEGGSEDVSANPKQALQDAIEALAEYEGITFVMSIEADADDLASDELPVEQAEQLVNSSVTFSGKASTPEEAQFEVAVNVGGNEDALEFKGVDESIYVRVEVRDLVEAFGGNAADIDMFVQQASAAGLDFAQPFADGEWVGIAGYQELAEQFGVQATPDPEKAKELQDRLLGILEENADVTSEGADDVGEHVVARVRLKQFVQETFDVLQDVSGAPAGMLPPLEGLDEIPDDATMPLDMWIDDGVLVQAEIDFVRFAEELGEDVPEGIDQMVMRFTFEEFTDEVEAPSDFVEIDLQEVIQGIFGAVPATGESSAGGTAVEEVPAGKPKVLVPELGVACSDLQMLSPEEIETFLGASGMPGAIKKVRKACPELF